MKKTKRMYFLRSLQVILFDEAGQVADEVLDTIYIIIKGRSEMLIYMYGRSDDYILNGSYTNPINLWLSIFDIMSYQMSYALSISSLVLMTGSIILRVNVIVIC